MNTYKLTIVTAILGLSLGQALAAIPQPLSNPKGLALDNKGNLYVANPGRGNTNFGGQILVYNTNFVQQPAKNIGGAGVNIPIGVAVNSLNQVYVANAGDATVTLYNGTAQDTNKTLTSVDGINSPSAISVDGVDNIWVCNHPGADTYIHAFPMSYPYNKTKLRTVFLRDYVPTFATSKRGPFFATTQGPYIVDYPIAELLANKFNPFIVHINNQAETMTIDDTGKVYTVGLNGDLECLHI